MENKQYRKEIAVCFNVLEINRRGLKHFPGTKAIKRNIREIINEIKTRRLNAGR